MKEISKEEKSLMRVILSDFVGIKELKAKGVDIDKICVAMHTHARRVSNKAYVRAKIEYDAKLRDLKHKKIVESGKLLKRVIKDYIHLDSGAIESISYVFPGNIEIRMKNVAEHDNKRKSYKQVVSDSYMKELCRLVHGHGNYEMLEEFDKESLIRKNKAL